MLDKDSLFVLQELVDQMVRLHDYGLIDPETALVYGTLLHKMVDKVQMPAQQYLSKKYSSPGFLHPECEN